MRVEARFITGHFFWHQDFSGICHLSLGLDVLSVPGLLWMSKVLLLQCRYFFLFHYSSYLNSTIDPSLLQSYDTFRALVESKPADANGGPESHTPSSYSDGC